MHSKDAYSGLLSQISAPSKCLFYNMETWKSVVGYEWHYEVSSLWNIRSLKNWKVASKKAFKTARGYLVVCICKNSVCRCRFVHRLVGMAFIENPEGKPDINHKNGIKTDNHLENLEWNTRSENVLHAFRNWLNRSTDKNHYKTNHPNKWKFWNSSPKAQKIIQMTKDGCFIREWGSIIDVEREIGIHQGNIVTCCKWKLKTAGKFKWKYKN